MDLQVTDSQARSRFEIRADGEFAGFADYHMSGAEIAFTHTKTEDRFRGHGLAGTLVQSALDAVRDRHLEVLPYCPFVRSWITGHREYADLVPAARRSQFGL
jgi:predicted GNAT family acetyltransferase